MAQRTVNIGIGNQVVQNDFDAMPIYKEMKEVTDDYGNKFIRIPKFYIHKENTTGKLAIRISKEPIAGGYLPHCFYDHVANKELPYVDVGKYLGSLKTGGGRLESKSGVTPLVSTTISGFRNLAKANGDGYQQLDIHVLDVLQCLFYVEFATLNSQTIHPGYTNGSGDGGDGGAGTKLTGGTDGVVASSGAMGTDDTYQFKYRGIEDPWGHLYQFVDGLNVNDYQAWVAKDARDYASDVFTSPYEKLSYVNHNTRGPISEMGYDPNLPFAQFPIAIGGNSNTYYGDNYVPNAGVRVMLYGGSYTRGVNAGISAWERDLASTSLGSYDTARLVRKPI